MNVNTKKKHALDSYAHNCVEDNGGNVAIKYLRIKYLSWTAWYGNTTWTNHTQNRVKNHAIATVAKL